MEVILFYNEFVLITMIRFDSDYLEGCLPQILEAFEKSNLEQTPGYGEDQYCEKARELVRAACGGSKELDIHFLVGGTQTNVAVISSILKPYQGAVCAQSGHINVHETGAVEHSGHKCLALPSDDGKISAGQIDNLFEEHFADPSRAHTVQPGMVYISFPTEKGTIYSKAETESIAAVCRKWNVPLFIDGARLGYGLCSPACDLNLEDIAHLADVFYIGGTKQGALFGECVVFKNGSLSKDFRYNIKQGGGMLAKGRLLGIQFATLFTDGLYFKAAQHAIDLAFHLKEALVAKGYSFLADSPTNQQFPIMENERIALLRERFSFEDWQKIDENHTAVRFCTSWATRSEAVEDLINSL